MDEFIRKGDFWDGVAHLFQNDDVADRLGHIWNNRMTPRDAR
jgi:hypothetical protein